MMGKAYVLCVAVHGLSLLLLGCGASLPRSRPNRYDALVVGEHLIQRPRSVLQALGLLELSSTPLTVAIAICLDAAELLVLVHAFGVRLEQIMDTCSSN